MIRDATPWDYKELATLMNELGYPTTDGEMKLRLSNIQLNPYYRTLVFEEKKLILGMVGMMLGFRYEKNESYIRILVLVVKKEYRDQGIGTKLLLEAEEWAKDKGANMITLNSGNRAERVNAHQFYLSKGFEGKATGFYKVLE